MNHTSFLFAFLLLFASTNIACEQTSQKKKKADNFLPVTKVVDGDTFWADNGTEKGIKIRLIGVDAPESRKMF
jgi:micrococcal nuclease